MPLWIVICGLGVTQIIGWGTTYYALGALSQEIAENPGWSTALIFGAFSASLLLSGLAQRTGRLGPGMITHAAFNATTVVILLLEDRTADALHASARFVHAVW